MQHLDHKSETFKHIADSQSHKRQIKAHETAALENYAYVIHP